MILTVQAVERASVIKNSKIVMPILGAGGHSVLGIAATGACWTDKITHAVGRKRVVIVAEIPFVGSTPDYLAVFDSTEAAVAGGAFRNTALVNTESATNSVLVFGGVKG
jgi:hypothetical protein